MIVAEPWEENGIMEEIEDGIHSYLLQIDIE